MFWGCAVFRPSCQKGFGGINKLRQNMLIEHWKTHSVLFLFCSCLLFCFLFLFLFPPPKTLLFIFVFLGRFVLLYSQCSLFGFCLEKKRLLLPPPWKRHICWFFRVSLCFSQVYIFHSPFSFLALSLSIYLSLLLSLSLSLSIYFFIFLVVWCLLISCLVSCYFINCFFVVSCFVLFCKSLFYVCCCLFWIAFFCSTSTSFFQQKHL